MDTAAIALNRFGLGARPDDSIPGDPPRWLRRQFEAFEPRPQALAGIPDRHVLVSQLADYLQQARMERQAKAAAPPAAERPAAMAAAPASMQGQTAGMPQSARQVLRKGIREDYVKMNGARLDAALSAPAPFIERLVHFWSNHFAVSADKVQVLGLAGSLEFEAIRPHVMGRFFDMLLAVEQHPAMLLYLDQVQSVGPDSRAAKLAAARGNKRGLNENLGREIMELHTVGVHGGYNQTDVTEFARALTGWTVAGLARGAAARQIGANAAPGDFAFAEALHEPGKRTIMGRAYAQDGEAQGRAVLADLATSPATANHLATKLARHFAGDDPPPAMIARLQNAYLTSGGILPAVYEAIIASPEAWVAAPTKFKTPWEWTVSSLRAVSAREIPPQQATGALSELGQPTWRPGSPAGWDDIAASWAGPDALVRRVEEAQRIGNQSGAAIDSRALAEKVLPGSLSDATRTAVSRAESPQQGLALLLVSSEFLRR
jgi:uncharacterized protein (DUF1800 family)